MAVRWQSLVTVCLGLVLVAVAGGRARAELTVQDLTERAIPNGGPFVQDVTDAIRAFAARDYRTALDRLQNAKKLSPALPPAEVMMAQLYFDAGIARGGNAMLEMAINKSPQDPEAYLLLAERALTEGRLSEGAAMYQLLEKPAEDYNQNPNRRQDLRRRAYTIGAAIDQARGKLDGAKAKLEKLIAVDRQNASAHERLGRVLFAQGDQRGAYDAFKTAAEVDEKSPPPDLMMASLYTDPATAKRFLDRAVQTNPDDLRTQIGVADYLLKIGKIDEARTHAEKAVSLDPDGFDSNLMLGVLERMQGNFADAVKHLSAAHMQQPANANTMHHLGLALSELPDEASRLQGLQFAEMLVQAFPDNPDHLAMLGWINYRLDRKAHAQRYLTAALNTNRIRSTMMLSSEMGYYLANIAKDQGNQDEAVKLLRNSLNTEQPFAYRKAAETMLAELTKSGAAGTP